MPHRTRERLASRFPVHVTLKLRPGLPSLRRGRARRVVVGSLAAARGGRAHGYRICHYSVQGDHIHLVCEAASTERLSRAMQGLAVRLAKRLNGALGRRGAVWAERYHARILRTPREVRFALVYVLHNGRHHAMGPGQGPVPESCVDALSSAPWFDGWRERMRFAYGPDPPPVARPNTWLLSTGWRRHGLISVGESPAAKERAAHTARSW